MSRLHFTLQTNGTLLDDDWIAASKRHEITVGISIGRPGEINDQFRVDHLGRGSYEKTLQGIALVEHPV